MKTTQAMISRIVHDFEVGDGWWALLLVFLCVLITYSVYRALKNYFSSITKAESASRLILLELLPPVLLLILMIVAELVVPELLNMTIFSDIQVSERVLMLVASLTTIWLVLRIFFVLIFIAFQRAPWVQTVMRVIEVVVWISVFCEMTGIFNILKKQLKSLSFITGGKSLDPASIVSASLTVILTLLFTLAISVVIERKLLKVNTIAPNLQIVLGRLIKTILVTIGILFSLSLIGFPLTSLSIFGGALGVGLGFGLQKVMSNYVSGFIILSDRSLEIGDFITVNQFFGQVTQITTRYTAIRGVDGTDALVPNEFMLTSVVENHSYSNHELSLGTTVTITQQSDIGLAMQLMMEAIKRERRVLKEPAPNIFFKAFGEYGYVLEAKFWIEDIESGRLGLISSVNLSILDLFNEYKIEVAFPVEGIRHALSRSRESQ